MTGQQAQYLPLVLAAIVVLRFAFRELRLRTIPVRSLWIRPAIMVALYALLLWGLVESAPGELAAGLAWTAGGVVAGIIVGILIVANTAVSAGPRPGTIAARGNTTTLVIWIVALALRVGVRYVVPHADGPAAQFAVNCGTLALICAAFVVIALGFGRVSRGVR